MAELLERPDAARALAEYQEAVVFALQGHRQAQPVDARIRAADLPYAVVKSLQVIRRNTWAVYVPELPAAELRPLWTLLRGVPGAVFSRKARGPKVRVGERLWELAVEDYPTEATAFLPVRFALSCTLHFHADSRKLVVSNLNRAFPAGSLTVDLIRYAPSERLPVLQEVCFTVLTRPERESFRSLCQLDPIAWQTNGTPEALQDELWWRVRDLERDATILACLQDAHSNWEAAARKLTERSSSGWFSRALAESEQRKLR